MVSERGLAGTLQYLRAELGDDSEAFARLIGSAEALGFALAVTGDGAEDFADIMNDMENSAGALTEAWEIQADTVGTKVAASWQRFKNEGEELAYEVLPTLADGLAKLADGLAWLTDGTVRYNDDISDTLRRMENLSWEVRDQRSFWDKLGEYFTSNKDWATIEAQTDEATQALILNQEAIDALSGAYLVNADALANNNLVRDAMLDGTLTEEERLDVIQPGDLRGPEGSRHSGGQLRESAAGSGGVA